MSFLPKSGRLRALVSIGYELIPKTLFWFCFGNENLVQPKKSTIYMPDLPQIWSGVNLENKAYINAQLHNLSWKMAWIAGNFACHKQNFTCTFCSTPKVSWHSLRMGPDANTYKPRLKVQVYSLQLGLKSSKLNSHQALHFFNKFKQSFDWFYSQFSSFGTRLALGKKFFVFDHPSIIFYIDQSERLKENPTSKSRLWA